MSFYLKLKVDYQNEMEHKHNNQMYKDPNLLIIISLDSGISERKP